MLDAIPTRAWLLLALAIAAIAPARYVFEHIAHDPRRRDITQPPEDLGWRTTRRFIQSLAGLASIAAFAVFIFTPAAERLARSPGFWPWVMVVIGVLAATSAVRGLVTGRVEPILRGSSATYERATQPKRFWASLAWNAVFGVGLAYLGSLEATGWRGTTGGDRAAAAARHSNPCFDPRGGAETARARIAACDQFLAGTANDELRALAFAERGIGYDWLGDERRAIADYSQSLFLNPRDANTLYNRARLYARAGELPQAVADYDASLALQPRNVQARINRGLIYLDVGALDRARADFTAAHELAPSNPWPLANRGLVHAWAGEPVRARADFAAARAMDPANPVVRRGEAVIAYRAGDYRAAIRHLTEALSRDPNDQWALRMRADAWWKLGERDKARDDDDRLAQLVEAATTPPPG